MDYQKDYSEARFGEKLVSSAKSAGVKVIYAALLLFYTVKRPEVPTRVKAVIYGALGYFISPVDAIADLLPMVGYTDDIGVLLLALSICAMYVNDEVRQKARQKLGQWFGRDITAEILEVEKSF